MSYETDSLRREIDALNARISDVEATVARMAPVFDASIALRAADRGDHITDMMSIAEAEAIVAENRTGRALIQWRNAVDAVPVASTGLDVNAAREP